MLSFNELQVKKEVTDIFVSKCRYISLQLLTNKCTYIKFHIKTLKIAPTYFDPKIILAKVILKTFTKYFVNVFKMTLARNNVAP